MSNNRPTLQQIADILGITKNSVSKALRDSPNISRETKEKVKNLALELGYIPNLASSMFRNGKSNIVAFVIDEFMNPYNFQILNLIQSCLEEKKYILMTFVNKKDKFLTASMVEEICRNPIDGIISMLDVSDDGAALLKKLNKPLVTIGIDASSHGFTSILFKDYEIGKFAAHKLYELGGKNFLYACDIEQKFKIATDRCQGFIDGLKECGIILPLENVMFKDDKNGLKEILSDYLKQGKPLDSIFCFCDLNVITVIETLNAFPNYKEKNINIIGVDNIKSYIGFFTKVSSIDENNVELSRIACESLIKLINLEHIKYNSKVIKVDFFYSPGVTTNENK